MKKLFLSIAACALLSGCASRSYIVHPGAGGYVSGPATANQIFISQSYDTLSAADSIIQQTRSEFLANQFPAKSMPTVKAAFNALVQAYDTAQAAWVTYNASVTAGETPSQAALASAIAGLNTELTNLATAKGAQ